MRVLKCEMCGEVDLLKIDGEFVCQSCRTRYTPDEARKLLVEGSVTIDRSKEVDNFVILGLRSFEKIDMRPEAHEEARQYFKRALEINPDNIKAYLYLNILDFSDARSVELAKKSYRRVKELIFAQYEDEQQCAEILLDVLEQCLTPVFNVPVFYNNDLIERVRTKRDDAAHMIISNRNSFIQTGAAFFDGVSRSDTVDVRKKYNLTVSLLRDFMEDAKKYAYDYFPEQTSKLVYESAISCLALLEYMENPIEFLDACATGIMTRVANCSDKGLETITERKEEILVIARETNPDFKLKKTKREVCTPKKRDYIPQGHAPQGVDYAEYRRTRKYDPFSLLQ